jgi:hypothetical protein
VIDVALVVFAPGADAGVVNDSTAPKDRPEALDTIAQKKYVVVGARPATVWVYATGAAPDPSGASLDADDGTRTPNVSLHAPGSVVAYRNHPVVASPFGTPAPLSTADCAVTDVAADVVAEGAAASTRNEAAKTRKNANTRRENRCMRKPLGQILEKCQEMEFTPDAARRTERCAPSPERVEQRPARRPGRPESRCWKDRRCTVPGATGTDNSRRRCLPA